MKEDSVVSFKEETNEKWVCSNEYNDNMIIESLSGKLKIEEKLSKTSYSKEDLNQFKEDLLQLIREKDIIFHKKVKNYYDNIKETEKNYNELTGKLNINYNTILSSQAELNNRLDKLNTYDYFVNETKSQLMSHEIRINNQRIDFTKATQKYDQIYLDNLELPGYIGKYAKFKNCKEFFDDVIRELSRLNQYKEKNTIDLKGYKEKLETMIKTFNTLIENNNKSQIKYINEISDRNNNKYNDQFSDIERKMKDLRMENSKYSIELLSKNLNLSKDIEKIEKIKDEINANFNQKLTEFRLVTNNTVNQFHNFEDEFHSIKRKFLELAEFIKDIRFRKNIGGNLKKKDVKNIAKKLTTNKKFKKDDDKKFGSNNTKYEEDNNIDDKVISGSVDDKICRNLIYDSLSPTDSEMHINQLSNPKEYYSEEENFGHRSPIIEKKTKNGTTNEASFDANMNCLKHHSCKSKRLNLKKINVINDKINESVCLDANKKDSGYKTDYSVMANTGVSGELTNNSLTDQGGVSYPNQINNCSHFKTIINNDNDKTIKELASELEQSNNKLDGISSYNKEKIDKIKDEINKCNLGSNIVTEKKINRLTRSLSTSSPPIIFNNEQNINEEEKQDSSLALSKKFDKFDRRLVELEVFIKDKILNLFSQIRSLRTLVDGGAGKRCECYVKNQYNIMGNGRVGRRGSDGHLSVIEIAGKGLPQPISGPTTGSIGSKVSKKFISPVGSGSNVGIKTSTSNLYSTGYNPNNDIVYRMKSNFNSKDNLINLKKRIEKRHTIDAGGINNNIENINSNQINLSKWIELSKLMNYNSNKLVGNINGKNLQALNNVTNNHLNNV